MVTFFLCLVLVGGAIVAIVAMTLDDPDKPATEVRTPTRERLRRLGRVDLRRLGASGVAARPSDDTGASSLETARARIDPGALAAPPETLEAEPATVSTALLVAEPAVDEPAPGPGGPTTDDDAVPTAAWPLAPGPAPEVEPAPAEDGWAATVTEPAAEAGYTGPVGTWPAAATEPAGEVGYTGPVGTWPTTTLEPERAPHRGGNARQPAGTAASAAAQPSPLRRSVRLLRGAASLIVLLTVLGIVLAAVLAGAAAAVAIGVRAAIG